MEIDEINNNRIFVGRKILYLGWLEFYYSRCDQKLIKTAYFRRKRVYTEEYKIYEIFLFFFLRNYRNIFVEF